MHSVRHIDFDELDPALRSAPTFSARLFRKVLQGCTRLESLRQLGRVAALEKLAEAGAWTDATLRLLELELPNWSGASSERATIGPVPYPANRICALRSMTRRKSGPPWRIPQIRLALGIPVCCDNFVLKASSRGIVNVAMPIL